MNIANHKFEQADKFDNIFLCNSLNLHRKCQMPLIAKDNKFQAKLDPKLDESYFNILHSIYRITSYIFYEDSIKM